MPVTQDNVTTSTRMGANLVADGATFRVWAPAAEHVYVVLGGARAYAPDPDDALLLDPATGHWIGFVAGVTDGTKYRFWVDGPDDADFKRDPWARELEGDDYESRDGVVRDETAYPWHDQDFRSPAPKDLIVYQLHVGRFYAVDEHGVDRRPGRVATFLDAVQRVPYLADLGVTAVQPLPFAEFHTPFSQGYNGTDMFSPETDYGVPAAQLGPYLDPVNALLEAKGCAPLTGAQLESQVDQLKAFVDICHLYGLAVLPDVVYNHAGGELDRHSLRHFDWNYDEDIYFVAATEAGGPVFAFARPDGGVQDFLINNAKMLLREYHVDGFRFDQVTVIVHNEGWLFSQNLTRTLHSERPDAVLIAEYWDTPAVAVTSVPDGGLGFDVVYSDRLRKGVRGAIGAAAGGANANVDLGALRDGLVRPDGVGKAWQVYNYIENHDFILDADGGDHRSPRIPKLAHWDEPRSPFARSRSRVATGILLTAPGVPALFMGQEFLEHKLWSDDPHAVDVLISWGGMEGAEPAMRDFHAFTRALLWLRRRHPALRDDPVVVYAPDNANRVQAFHRWVEGVGRDVVVVASLSESPLHGYELGFPQPGRWLEVFNSDAGDPFPGPGVEGNAGEIAAAGPPLDEMAQSAAITIPANGLLVFARDGGD
jgi:1,4-alpha-glucan branching enzyme